MLEEYWQLMPEYQGVPLDSLEPLRILFGFFPTYRKASTLWGWCETCIDDKTAVAPTKPLL